MSKFLNQPSAKYRNFQIMFTILTLNFAIPTLSYIFAPEVAHAQFTELNLMLGGEPYTFLEAQSRFWRYLGAANVATLAFMCGLLQWDLRKNYPVLVPLTFMKSLAATLWLAGFIAAPEYPAFLAAALLDYGSSFAFVFFASRAYHDIRELSDGELRPPPSPWRAANRRVANLALDAVLPTSEPLESLVHDDLAKPNVARMNLGFRFASWALVFGPIATHFRRPLWQLSRPERDTLVVELGSSPRWFVRQLVEVVKLVAAFAWVRR